MIGVDFLDNSQIQDSSSSSDEQLHPSRPSRPAHGRSMSNPFPSLFSGKKKKKGRSIDPVSDSDSSGEDGQGLRARGKAQQRPRGHTPSGSRDFTTGQCMTCGSLVRWPKDLLVFKCTICLTINDIQPPWGPGEKRDHEPSSQDAKPLPPLPAERATERAQEKTSTLAPAVPSRPPPLPPLQPSSSRRRDISPPAYRDETGGTRHRSMVIPISLERTNTIIAQCLTAFLDAVLTEPAEDACAAPSESIFRQPYDPFRSDEVKACPGCEQPSSIPTCLDRLSPPNPAAGEFLNRTAHPLHGPPRRSNPMSRSYSTSYPERNPVVQEPTPRSGPFKRPTTALASTSQNLFKPLESYLISSFTSFRTLSSSFKTAGPAPGVGLGNEPVRRSPPGSHKTRRDYRGRGDTVADDHPVPDLDAKLLLLGDVAENGTWWAGGRESTSPTRTLSHSNNEIGSVSVSQRTPRIDWTELNDWYGAVINCGQTWMSVYEGLVKENPFLEATSATLSELESQILGAQAHAQRTLLKVTEMVLKRPGRRISRPADLRFLLIIFANPLLRPSYRPFAGRFGPPHTVVGNVGNGTSSYSRPAHGRHSNIVKRLVGLISNAPSDCHAHFVSWLARYSTTQFVRTKELVGSFLAYRLVRQNDKKYDPRVDVIDGLIPSMSAGHSAASLHAALGHPPGPSKKPKEKPKVQYHDDWQIKAAAQVMALIFSANNLVYPRRSLAGAPPTACNDSVGFVTRDGIHARGQLLPTSDFYTTLLDNSDLLADFEAWEHKSGKFSFCQYPFLLSIWAKIQILEYDARRQMQTKARDAFFDSIMSRRAIEQYLVLNVRRDCLVEDSLRAVSEVIGMGGEDIKKGLRIAFKGEEGVDAGGLRKEWFLLLVREVFNPEHGTKHHLPLFPSPQLITLTNLANILKSLSFLYFFFFFPFLSLPLAN